MAVSQRFQWPPSSSLINLLEQLTEPKETFSLVDHWFIMEGYNSGTSRWKRWVGQGMGKGHGASMLSLSAPLSPNLYVFINLEAFQTLSFCGFMEALLHRHSCSGHWPLVIELNLQPLSCLWRLGMALKVSIFWSHGWLHWQQSPTLSSFPKVTSLT